MSCSVASKQNQLITAQTSNGKYPFGFRGSSNLIKMGPIQNNQKIMVHLLWGSTAHNFPARATTVGGPPQKELLRARLLIFVKFYVNMLDPQRLVKQQADCLLAGF